MNAETTACQVSSGAAQTKSPLRIPKKTLVVILLAGDVVLTEKMPKHHMMMNVDLFHVVNNQNSVLKNNY